MNELRMATYNAHQWVGMDKKRDFHRCMRVIKELEADVVGLQEVTVPHHENPKRMTEYLTEASGMRACLGPTMFRGDSAYGNVMLFRRKPLRVKTHELSQPGREPRGAIETQEKNGQDIFRVITTHLGLRHWERKRQTNTLLEVLTGEPATFLVLMGDFNGWFPWGGPALTLDKWFGMKTKLRTYPSYFPALPLDKLWVHPADCLKELRVHTSPLTRVASDHLPLVATLTIP